MVVFVPRDISPVRPEEIPEIFICFHQIILPPAGDIELWNRSLFLQHFPDGDLRIQIGFRCCRQIFKQADIRFLRQILKEMERGRQARSISKGVRKDNAVSKRSVPSHGKSCNKRILTLIGKREHSPRHLNQLFPDKGLIIIPGCSGLKIKSVIPGGHYHRKILLLCPHLDPRPAHPVRIISQKAVQKIQCLVSAVRFLQIRVRIGIKLVHRQYHIQRNDTKQSL